MTQVIEGLRKGVDIVRCRPAIAIGIGVASLAALDELGDRAIWRNREPSKTKIHLIPSDSPVSPREASPIGVVFQGAGRVSGESKARQMQDTLLGDQLWAYFDYGHQTGVTNEIFSNELAAQKEKLGYDSIDCYCHCIGLQMGLPAVRDAGIKLRILVINSSPSNIQNMKGSPLKSFLSRFMPYDGGLIGRFVTSAARSVAHGERAIITNAKIDIAKKGSNKLTRSEVNLFRHTNLLRDWSTYQGNIVPGYTQALYIAPPVDNVVRKLDSYRDLQLFFNQLGVPLDYLEMPEGSKHADPQAVDVALTWIENALQKY